MKHKKKIKADIKQILADSGVDKHLWEKCLARLVNYTDKVRTEHLVGEVLRYEDNLPN